jgi:hypothetical protein
MGDLCTGIATKCKPYTLDQSKAMNKKEKACDKDYITSSCCCKHFSIGLKMSSIKRFIPVPLARNDEVEL